MKLFAMLMLRCALVMLLSSFLQNGTLAVLDEWNKLREWATPCQEVIKEMPLEINQKLDLLLEKVNEFPIGGMEELSKRRLQKPLKIAIGNYKKLEDEHKKGEHSAERHSIVKGIYKEFNTFFFEVELELIKQDKLTLGNKKEFENLFYDLWKWSENNASFCDTDSFKNAWFWTQRIEKTKPPPNQKELDEQLLAFILDAKLGILKNELSEKIAVFEKQQPPHIDGDGFLEFSSNFKLEWEQIDDIKMELQVNTQEFADIKTYRERLDDLAEIAMKKTAPLKSILTKKLDELIAKCENSPLKNLLKKVKQSLKKSDQKEEAKKEIDAMKQIISDIGMFDGAANKLLVRFEHEKLDNTDFCDQLKEAVKEDKKMLSTAYQVQQDNELRRMK